MRRRAARKALEQALANSPSDAAVVLLVHITDTIDDAGQPNPALEGVHARLLQLVARGSAEEALGWWARYVAAGVHADRGEGAEARALFDELFGAAVDAEWRLEAALRAAELTPETEVAYEAYREAAESTHDVTRLVATYRMLAIAYARGSWSEVLGLAENMAPMDIDVRAELGLTVASAVLHAPGLRSRTLSLTQEQAYEVALALATLAIAHHDHDLAVRALAAARSRRPRGDDAGGAQERLRDTTRRLEKLPRRLFSERVDDWLERCPGISLEPLLVEVSLEGRVEVTPHEPAMQACLEEHAPAYFRRDPAFRLRLGRSRPPE